MRINSPGGFTYVIVVMRCHPLTQTLSPSGGEGDQGGWPCLVTQKNLPQKAPEGVRKQAKGGIYVSVLLLLQNSLGSYRARFCWGVALGLFLCMSCYAAPGTVGRQSLSQELKQRDEARARASITVADGRLSVNLRQAELREVLSRIGQEAGFSLMMPSTGEETISTQFTDMTLIEGLRRLLQLASLSYAMVYNAEADPKGRLKELWVLGAKNDGAHDFPTTGTRHDAVAVTEPEHSQQESSATKNPLLALFHSQRPDTVPPSREVPFMQLMKGQRPEPDALPQPSPFLDAVNGRRPSPTSPAKPSPFLDAVNRQRPKAAEPPQNNPPLKITPGQPQP